mgnify:CR=1 FL=1
MRKAVIESATGKVVNVIEIADGATWTLPMGHSLRDAGNASPGDTWDGAKFVARAPTAEQIVATKREAARVKAVTAILANKTGAPWGVILYDVAVAQGLIEP